MAKNDPNHPEIARAAQDVEAPAHREPDGPHHYGRGGAANIAKLSEEEKRQRLEEGNLFAFEAPVPGVPRADFRPPGT